MLFRSIHPFNPEEKVIEYVMAANEKSGKRLIEMSLCKFANEIASESPAPGGGSVSACMGALGVALGTMVANLSSHKRGWDERWEEFSSWAEKGKDIQNRLLQLVDEDTVAFNRILEAYGLPKKTDEEKAARNEAIQDATRNAIMVPLKVMETAFSSFGLLQEMVEKGNPASITDAGVGVLAVRSCIRGAYLNVLINASGLQDKNNAHLLIESGKQVEVKAIKKEEEILNIIYSRIKNTNS